MPNGAECLTARNTGALLATSRGPLMRAAVTRRLSSPRGYMASESSSQFAVVTGASSGIGLELARQFAQHGFDLLICAENQEIERAAGELRSEGQKVDALRVDLATYDGVEQLWSAIQRSGRQLDAIAINAGVGSSGPFAETDLEKELNLVQLNVTSVVHLAKRVVQ